MKTDIEKAKKHAKTLIVIGAIVAAIAGIAWRAGSSELEIGMLLGIGLASLSYGTGLLLKTRKMNGEFQGAEAAVSPVIGVILMVAITVVLAAIVFVLVTQLSENTNTNSPRVSFQQQDDGATLMVVSAPTGLDWGDFAVTGCTTIPTGTVDAGDKLEVCGAEVLVTHTPSNSVVYSR